MAQKAVEESGRLPDSLRREQNRALAIWFAKVAARRGYIPPLPASVYREDRKTHTGGVSQQ